MFKSETVRTIVLALAVLGTLWGVNARVFAQAAPIGLFADHNSWLVVLENGDQVQARVVNCLPTCTDTVWAFERNLFEVAGYSSAGRHIVGAFFHNVVTSDGDVFSEGGSANWQFDGNVLQDLGFASDVVLAYSNGYLITATGNIFVTGSPPAFIGNYHAAFPTANDWKTWGTVKAQYR